MTVELFCTPQAHLLHSRFIAFLAINLFSCVSLEFEGMPGTAKDSLDQGIQQKRIESFFKKTPLAKRKERSSPMPFGSSRVKRKRDLQSCLRENSRDDDEIEVFFFKNMF